MFKPQIELKTKKGIQTSTLVFVIISIFIATAGTMILSALLVLNQLTQYQIPEKMAEIKVRESEYASKYAPNEIIIKFRASNLVDTFKEKTKTNKNFKIIGKELKTMNLPQQLKDIIDENETFSEPVFKELHQEMAVSGKSEAELNQITFSKISKNRKMLIKEPKNYHFANIYIFKNINNQNQSITQLAKRFSLNSNIEYAEPNYIAEVQGFPQSLPNDTYINPSADGSTWGRGSWNQNYEDMWGLKKIQAVDAWRIFDTNSNGMFDTGETKPGQDVIVAVIDTGVDYTHEDLTEDTNDNRVLDPGEDQNNNGILDSNIWTDVRGKHGYDFFNNDDEPLDDNGHGTHVSGTIAAMVNNGRGTAGVAPYAKIMAIKGFNANGSGNTQDLVRSISYAANNNARIINNSWGGFGFSRTIEDAVNYAYDNGSVVIASAGNSNLDAKYSFPANIDRVITVAAIDQNDIKTYFSNFGNKIDVSAPGGGSNSAEVYNILSTMPDNSVIGRERPNLKVSNGYWRLAGTSMAAPHVAGLAALVFSRYQNYTNLEVMNQIIGTADNIDSLNPMYAGKIGEKINSYKALTQLPILTPKIRYFNYQIDDDNLGNSRGNGNGIIEQDETIELNITLKNYSFQGAIGVSAQLRTSDPNINIIGGRDMSIFGDIPSRSEPGSEISSQTPFVFSILSTKPFFEPIEFSLDIIDSSGYHFNDTFKIIPNIKIELITTPYGSNLYPAVSGNIIVWEYRSTDIYMYDISTGQERPITTNPAKQINPAISGNRIVWEDYRNGNADIYMYDISTGQEERITEGLTDQITPNIDGNKIVWGDNVVFRDPYQRKNDGVGDIYVYDILTRGKIRIPLPRSYLRRNPAISGNKIVWEDYKNSPDVYMYNLSTNKLRQITNEMEYEGWPHISGNKVVFNDQDSRGGISISMYDIGMGKKLIIPNDFPTQTFSNISGTGNRIVWSDYRYSPWEWHIYMATLSFPPPQGPSNLTATLTIITNIKINLSLSWVDNSNSEEGFKIERKMGTDDIWSQVGIMDSDTTTYNDINLAENTSYYYRVKAYNSSGDSEYSNEVNVTTPDIPQYLTDGNKNTAATDFGNSFDYVIDLLKPYQLSSLTLYWKDFMNKIASYKVEGYAPNFCESVGDTNSEPPPPDCYPSWVGLISGQPLEEVETFNFSPDYYYTNNSLINESITSQSYSKLRITATANSGQTAGIYELKASDTTSEEVATGKPVTRFQLNLNN